MIIPNTYLIGVQKAATTSFYNWLSQHPNICAPIGLKDIEFFIRPEYYEENGIKYLSDRYAKEFLDQKIILQGCVHYVFFEKAIERIKESNKESKLFLILRNPIERAISAYHYAKKFNYEDLPLYEAFEQEPERMLSSDFRTLSELTYINHSLYFKQIKKVLEYFAKDQLHIIFYEDLKSNPQKVVERAFEFLKIDSKFQVDFKIYNNTGTVKYKTFQKIAFGNNPVRNFLVRNILKKIIPENLTKKMRWRVMDINTVQKKSNYLDEIDSNFKNQLFNSLIHDIESLEQELGVSLDHWKVKGL